jgi:hypothetical protein
MVGVTCETCGWMRCATAPPDAYVLVVLAHLINHPGHILSWPTDLGDQAESLSAVELAEARGYQKGHQAGARWAFERARAALFDASTDLPARDQVAAAEKR